MKKLISKIFTLFLSVCLIMGVTLTPYKVLAEGEPKSLTLPQENQVAETDNIIESVESAEVLTDGIIARDNAQIYSKPMVSPSGKLLSFVKQTTFAQGTYDWIENDDWDWDTYASKYGVRLDGMNQVFSLYPAGGGYNPSFEVWVPAYSISGTSAVSVFYDFSKMANAENIKLKFKLCTSELGDISNPSNLTRTVFVGTAYYYDYVAGEYVEAVSDREGIISLPDSFKGYIYLPMAGFSALSTDGVGGSFFVQMYHMDMWVGENFENSSEIIIDDIDIVVEGEAHTHEYTLTGTVEPTCKLQGLNLNTCSCGQVKWTDMVECLGHSVGNKFYATESLSSAVCTTCGALEFFEETSTTHWENAVSVKYDYLSDYLTDITVEYPSGITLAVDDIFYEYKAVNGIDNYQFFRFTSDELGVYGNNPVGLTLSQDITLYAHYNLCSYDGEKFRAMNSDISFNGGPYIDEQHSGKIIMIGASNMSLWHNMENWYSQRGYQVLNNSVAGSSSYNYLEFVQELILMYRPKMVITQISSNDLCYHQMTDKQIMENTQKFYDAIQEACPGTPMILMTSGYLPGRVEYFTAVTRINKKTEKFCEKNEFAYFIDSTEGAMDAVMSYPNGWDTWTHRGQEYCEQIYGTKLLPYIENIAEQLNISFS